MPIPTPIFSNPIIILPLCRSTISRSRAAQGNPATRDQVTGGVQDQENDKFLKYHIQIRQKKENYQEMDAGKIPQADHAFKIIKAELP